MLKRMLIFICYLAAYAPSGPFAIGGAVPAFLLYILARKFMSPVKAFIYGFFFPITIFHYGAVRLMGRNPGENVLEDVAEGMKFLAPQICKSCKQDVTPGVKTCPACGSSDLAIKQ